jgi:RimJ/RimL family protein N-acetyltransferase
VIGNIYLAQQEPQEIRTWELGYVFNAAYWGKGYASEACMAIMEYAFDTLRAHRIVAMCNPKNVASWKLLERLNFRREGHQVKNMYFKTDTQGAPIWNDTYMYAMLSVEYLLRRYHEI